MQHVSRTGKTYYLHAKRTRAGKTTYFFSLRPEGAPVNAVPEGFEVYENMQGQVFLRRKTTPVIRPNELAIVEASLRDQGEAWQWRAEVKKNTITVYEAGNMEGISALVAECQGRTLSAHEELKYASYMAVMRFVLQDKKTRAFVTERFCYRGSVEDWIYLDGPAPLDGQVKKYVKHLGRDSCYELF